MITVVIGFVTLQRLEKSASFYALLTLDTLRTLGHF